MRPLRINDISFKPWSWEYRLNFFYSVVDFKAQRRSIEEIKLLKINQLWSRIFWSISEAGRREKNNLKDEKTTKTIGKI